MRGLLHGNLSTTRQLLVSPGRLEDVSFHGASTSALQFSSPTPGGSPVPSCTPLPASCKVVLRSSFIFFFRRCTYVAAHPSLLISCASWRTAPVGQLARDTAGRSHQRSSLQRWRRDAVVKNDVLFASHPATYAPLRFSPPRRGIPVFKTEAWRQGDAAGAGKK